MKKIEKKIIGLASRLLGMTDVCPVIYYHDIVEEGQGFSYQKTERSVFERQMKFIAESGLRTLTFDDLRSQPDALKQKGNILICFDDGYLSNYTEAYPICKKWNVKFNIFIEGKAVTEGAPDYMSPAQMKELHDSGLVGIGAHTWSHIDCAKDLSDASYEAEVLQENSFLCEALGVDSIPDFCFPFGSYREETLRFLEQKAVYKRIYTSDNKKPVFYSDSLILGRIAIENTDSDAEFADKALGKFGAYRLFKAAKNLVAR